MSWKHRVADAHHRHRTIVAAVADASAVLGDLIAANPPQARYGTQRAGSRSADDTSSTERCALTPDPIETVLRDAERHQTAALASLEAMHAAMRTLGPGVLVERPKTVTCEVCSRWTSTPRSSDGHGPLCKPCCESRRIARHAALSWPVWLARRRLTLEAAASQPGQPGC